MKNNNLDFYWKQILALKIGERCGNHHGVVFRYVDYFLLDTEDGIKRTHGLDAARYLAGVYQFCEVSELLPNDCQLMQ